MFRSKQRGGEENFALIGRHFNVNNVGKGMTTCPDPSDRIYIFSVASFRSKKDLLIRRGLIMAQNLECTCKTFALPGTCASVQKHGKTTSRLHSYRMTFSTLCRLHFVPTHFRTEQTTAVVQQLRQSPAQVR